MSHRLFVALRPPPAVRDALLDLMDGIAGARWQDDDQLHLTLRYIGEVDRHRANAIAAALERIGFAPFAVEIASLGTFQRKGQPHTLFAAVKPSPPLLALQRKVERACVMEGLTPETRKFTPHITLARLNRSSGAVAPVLARHAGFVAEPWECDAIHLYESHLRAAGSLYLPVARFPATMAG